MSNYIIQNGELYHYGVKGMKWDKNKRVHTDDYYDFEKKNNADANTYNRAVEDIEKNGKIDRDDYRVVTAGMGETTREARTKNDRAVAKAALDVRNNRLLQIKKKLEKEKDDRYELAKKARAAKAKRVEQAKQAIINRKKKAAAALKKAGKL